MATHVDYLGQLCVCGASHYKASYDVRGLLTSLRHKHGYFEFLYMSVTDEWLFCMKKIVIAMVIIQIFPFFMHLAVFSFPLKGPFLPLTKMMHKLFGNI